RMQRALGRETLNCGDLRTVVHDGKRQARIDAPPVNEHGAGAALALIAAFFRPRQVQMLAQQVKERCAGIEHEGMMRPIDDQAHRDCLRRRQTGGRHPQLLLIGIVVVVAFAASAEGLPIAAITVTWRRTRSAANAGSRSYWLYAQRYSIVTFWPST